MYLGNAHMYSVTDSGQRIKDTIRLSLPPRQRTTDQDDHQRHINPFPPPLGSRIRAYRRRSCRPRRKRLDETARTLERFARVGREAESNDFVGPAWCVYR